MSIYDGTEYDVSISVTFRGCAVQITARGTFDGDIMAEANDLDSIDEARGWLRRELARTDREAPTSVEVVKSTAVGSATFTLALQRWGIAPHSYEVAVSDHRPDRNRFTVIGQYASLDHALSVFDAWTRTERERFA